MIQSQVNVIPVCADAPLPEEFGLKYAPLVMTLLSAAASHLIFISSVL